MKNIILIIGILWVSTSFEKKDYITFEPFGNSDKSLPSLIISKDSTNIKELGYFDSVNIINDSYYDTLKNIVIKCNPKRKVEADYSGNFKISVNDKGEKTIFFLNQQLSNKLFRSLIKSIKQHKNHKKLLWEFEDILSHN